MPDENGIRRLVRKVVYRTLGLTRDEDSRQRRPLVTELDVRDLPVGSGLPVASDALITPLARQVAMERKVNFVSTAAAQPATTSAHLGQVSSSGGKVIAIGADHGGFELKGEVVQWLEGWGHEVLDLGAKSYDKTDDYPDFAFAVGEAVQTGKVERGIVICGSGVGACIIANKVPGIRAALCDDAETARGARLWNNANVLCLSLRRISEVEAGEILKTWFESHYQANPEDDACLAQIDKIESKYASSP